MIVNTSIVGTRPLIVHDVMQLANPLSGASVEIKKLTSKRNKTPADILEIARLEWVASLYYSDTEGPIMPTRCLAAMIRSGAKKKKLGKVIQESVLIPNDVPILYDGPRDFRDMWADERFSITVPCKVGQAIVMRTRPIFSEWKIDFVIDFEETQLNPAELQDILRMAGLRIGLCDWRPTYGRFTLDRFEEIKLAA
jgi:hypothetical protein